MATFDDIEYPLIVAVTVVIAGIVSGLNLALFSLDIGRLKAQASGDGKKSAAAKKVARLMANPHWVLVTLLVANAAAVESMPLALNQLVSSDVASIAISVVLVLTFGEIIPQALFVSHALTVGALFSYFVWFLMIITAPISLCMAYALDKLIGHRDTQLYRRRELLELIKIQGDHKDIAKAVQAEEGNNDDDGGLARLLAQNQQQSPSELAFTEENGLTEKELRMMMGALKLSDMTIRRAVKTRAESIFSVSLDAVVDKEFVRSVYESGFSRIPVYEGHRDNITKYLIAKTLVLTMFAEEGSKHVRDLTLVNATELGADVLLSVAYTYFSEETSSSHMVFIRDEDNARLYGLFTFDDLLDQINGTGVDPEVLASSFSFRNSLRRSLNGTWNDPVSSASRYRPANPSSGLSLSSRSASQLAPPSMFIERTQSGYQVRNSGARLNDRESTLNSSADTPTVLRNQSASFRAALINPHSAPGSPQGESGGGGGYGALNGSSQSSSLRPR